MDVTVQEVSADIRGPSGPAGATRGGAAQQAPGPVERDRLVALETARRERHKHRLEAY